MYIIFAVYGAETPKIDVVRQIQNLEAPLNLDTVINGLNAVTESVDW